MPRVRNLLTKFHRRYRSTGSDDAVTFAEPAAVSFEQNNPSAWTTVLAAPSFDRVEQVAKQLREALKIDSHIASGADGRFRLNVPAESAKQFGKEIDALIRGVPEAPTSSSNFASDATGTLEAQLARRKLEQDARDREQNARSKELDRREAALEAEIRNSQLSSRDLARRVSLRVEESSAAGGHLGFAEASTMVLDAVAHRNKSAAELPAGVIARRAGILVADAAEKGRYLSYSDAVAEVCSSADSESVAFAEPSKCRIAPRVLDVDTLDRLPPPGPAS